MIGLIVIVNKFDNLGRVICKLLEKGNVVCVFYI